MLSKSFILKGAGIAAFLQLVLACADMFRSPYESFTNSMRTTVQLRMTIDELKAYDGWGTAADKYLMDIEKLRDVSHYHYAHPNIWKSYCYYYLVVNNETQKVVDWGFDYDKADPKKTCGASG